MQEQSDLELAKAFQILCPEIKDSNVNYIASVVGLIKERATFVSDFWELSHYFFISPRTYNEKGLKKAVKEDTGALLTELKEQLSSEFDFTIENIQDRVKGWITDNNIGFGKVMMPLRLALVGDLQGPEVFDIMSLLGKEETLSRLDNLMSVI